MAKIPDSIDNLIEQLNIDIGPDATEDEVYNRLTVYTNNRLLIEQTMAYWNGIDVEVPEKKHAKREGRSRKPSKI